MSEKEFSIRTATSKDLENLKRFFIKAYGQQTVFQSEEFLLYYFQTLDENSAPFRYSLIAENSDGEIVSHYGGLHYRMKLGESVVPAIWGVNAYTLPEWRGKGINGRIVQHIRDNNEVNAAMGMTFDAAQFYKKLGYTIFDSERMIRFVYVFDPDAFEVAAMIGYSAEKARELLRLKKPGTLMQKPEEIIELTKDNFEQFTFDLDADVTATTYRDVDFLRWRLFNNPFIQYKVFGYRDNNKIVSYIAIREEILEPTSFKASRIIDLFGNQAGVGELLQHAIRVCQEAGSLYIDFFMFGDLYREELVSSGFDLLEEDEVCFLPMVSSPIEKRPNHEYVTLQSKEHEEVIQKLTQKDVYITRIDSDRDRVARISQIKGS